MQHITFFGTYDTSTTPRIQVLIEGLRASGITVAECNVPLKLSTADRVKILSQPWRLPVLGIHIMSCWLQLTVKSRSLEKTDAVIVGHLGQFDVRLARWLFRGTPLALDYMISGSDTAKDRRLHTNRKAKLLAYVDNAALRVSNVIIVDTYEHLQNLPKLYRHKGVVVAIGAPTAWFQTSAAIRKKIPLRVIFFGAFTPLQGTATIARALARLHAPIEVTMAGSGQDLSTAQQLAKKSTVNITWVDWVPAADLPRLVAQHDVCLGIFGTGPKAFRVVPNKVFQGAATGCVIVTSDTEPQRRTLGDSAYYVPAGDDIALARALEELAAKPQLVRKLRHDAQSLATQAFRPESITRPLVDALATYALK